MVEPKTLISGRGLVESPRWHEGALWFADWTTGEILRLDASGVVTMVARASAPPLSFDFLADDTILIVSSREGRLLRRETEGVTRPFVTLGDGLWNEIVVDGRGNTYVNGPKLLLIRPNGEVESQADGFAFPNGMAITADNKTLILAESHAQQLTAFDISSDGRLSGRRVWADLNGAPDGICLDVTGAVWYADVPNRRCRRVYEGGEVLDEILLDRGAFACMLGGTERCTLYITAASWFGMDRMSEMVGTGRVLSLAANFPGTGWP